MTDILEPIDEQRIAERMVLLENSEPLPPDWYSMLEKSMIRMAQAGIEIPNEFVLEMGRTLMNALAQSADYRLQDNDVQQG